MKPSRSRCSCLLAIIVVCAAFASAELSGSSVPVNEGRAGRRPVASWTEEEFEDVHVGSDAVRPEEKKAQSQQQRPPRLAQEHYYFEAAFVVFLVIYGINVWRGRRKNEQIALAWARAFCGEGSVLQHNFALLGPGDSDDGEVLMKQSQHSFQLYASGRRYCSSLLATLDLKARQDLLSLAYYAFEPRDDTLEIDVAMNEANMAPMCLLVGLPKISRALLKSRHDLATFTKQVDVAKDRIRDWPAPSLLVHAESATLFYELFVEQILEQAFNAQVFNTSTAKYFRYLLFTTDNEGPPRKLLRFSFRLPALEDMHELSRLMDLVMKFIDLVPNVQLPQKLREKAEAARADERKKAEKESRRQQDEELQKKKQERKEAEIDRVKKLGPEARAKYEERQKRIEQQRLMRKRTIKG